MEICPIIEIFPTEFTVNPFADSNGRVLLDVSEQTTVSINNTLKVQDDVFQIGSIPDLTLTLPITPKNFFYLKSLYDPNTEKPVGVYMTARVTVGSETFIYDKMYAVNKGSAIEVKFKYGSDWVDKLRNLKLCDLDTLGQPGFLGFADLTKQNVTAKWTNNSLYADGDDGYWFPLVHYGGWREQEYHMVVTEDLRPLFHTLWLMRKCFEAIGWCLEFPFYETTLGRRCIDYLLKSDYGDEPALRNQRRFSARHGIGVIFQPGKLDSWTELLDNGNNFDPSTGYYTGVFEGKLLLRVTHPGTQLNPGQQIPTVTLTVYKERQLIGGGTVSILAQLNITTGFTPGDHLLEIETSVTPNERIYVDARSNVINLFNDHVGGAPLTLYFSNEVKATYHQHGDVLNLAYEIDPNISAWDYMLGNIHFMSGIAIELPTEKKVRILTPFNADIYGEVIEGYFNDTLVSLRDQQPLEATNSVARDQLRVIKMAFAKTTDELAKRLNGTNNQEPFSKSIDLGDPLIETEENRNPLFEYTLLELESRIIHLEDLGAGLGGYYLPQMIDNDEGKISNNIKPRKIVAYGYDTQLDGTARIVFESQLQNLIPFAAQDGSKIPFGGVTPTIKLIYGNDTDDLWSLVLGRFIMQFRQRLQLDTIAYFSHLQFFGIDLRNRFEIDYDGHPVTGRIVTINDWKPCDIISAQVLIMPDLTTDNYCLESPPDNPCLNNVFLILDQLGTCYTFSIGGQPFTCNVTGIVWEMIRESEDEWTEIGTGNTVTVCDEEETFTVRAKVTFDCVECPDEYAAKTIHPCANAVTCLLFPEFENGQQCVGWSLDSDQSLDDCTVIATLSIYLNGGLSDVVILEQGELYCPIDPTTTLLILDVEVTCGVVCPTIITQCHYIPGQAPPGGPCDNFPVLECIPVDIGGAICYEFVIGGSMETDYEYFVVSGTCDGEPFTWMQGDDPICCSGIITASAMVHYCDCPAVCTDEIECEGSGCTMFNAGTAIQLFVCA